MATIEQEEGFILSPNFDENGLIAAIAQDVKTREILMLAWMNPEALERTLQTGQAHYWSRSRGELWHKGATSGAVQHVVEMRIDCDQDAVVMIVEQAGSGACHTGRPTCFYRRVKTDADGNVILCLEGENSEIFK